MLNKRVVRLVVSLLATLAITYLLVVSTSEKQVVYVPVVVATKDIEANAALTPENLEVRSIPITAVPEKAFSVIPGGKLAGQKIWKGEYLLPAMVKDHPVTLPEPGNRIYSIPVTLQSAGGIQPGDRVDVFLFTADQANRGGGESKLLLSGVTVMEILNQNGQAITGKEGKTQGSAAVPSVAQVLVTVAQANLLNAAANTGELSLARYLPHSQPVKDVPTLIVTGGSIQ